jgi:hypothetical protein
LIFPFHRGIFRADRTDRKKSQKGKGVKPDRSLIVPHGLGGKFYRRRRGYMKRPWIILFAIVLCAGLTAGCATTSISSAQAQLKQAKDAGAVWTAPYEYYAADAYLTQAAHQAEDGNSANANMFAQKSLDYSAKALSMAKGGAK